MKKQLSKLIIALLLSIIICVPSALAVLFYTKPMTDVTYDLSICPQDGQEWKGDKGWTVYTNVEGKITELTPDGAGGYMGADYLGQTFYYSRTLTEELDSPTLRIGTVNQTVSIYLDNDMIYTDWPELDNRIGYLELPMLMFDRTDAIIVSLPPDYLGKTLTIAQSSPAYSEVQKDTITVWPCNVTLYCGYTYESSFIASASSTMFPAVLLFSLELLLLAAFIWNASVGNFSLRLPVFALAILFRICSVLSKADFFTKYFGIPFFDPVWLFFHLSAGALLLFLTLHTDRLRPMFAACTALQWCVSVLHLLVQTGKIIKYGDMYVFFLDLPKTVGFLTLLVTLVGGVYLAKKGSRFFRHMSQAALVIVIGYVLFLIISIPFLPGYTTSVLSRLYNDLTLYSPNLSLKLVYTLCLVSGLFAVVMEFIEQEMERRTELAVLAAKNELAMESYDNLRRQSEEVMMLRHDTMKHYTLLRTMAEETPERLTSYLDELIGQVEAVRPVVDSQNQILNILINGKLNTASDKGISTEITRSDAPAKLPLTDTELCCLIVNILDNAINAASESKKPEIKLDFHCNDNHFIFSCENSMAGAAGTNKKIPTPEHGYGLKIIRQIMKRWGDNMISVEEAEDTYKITVVIPLSD